MVTWLVHFHIRGAAAQVPVVTAVKPSLHQKHRGRRRGRR
jgi:hypothetical protein